jgi:IS30 family transposase
MLLHLPPMDGRIAPGSRTVLRSPVTEPRRSATRSLLTWGQGAEMAQHAQLRIELACRSTSAIHRARGSAPRTRTPTGCCASTSRRAPTWAFEARRLPFGRHAVARYECLTAQS